MAGDGRNGIGKVLRKVLVGFQPYRKADHAVRYTQLRPRFGADPLVRRRCRMGHKAFGIAQIVGNADEAQRVEAVEGPRLAPSTSKVTICPPPGICLAASAAWG